MKKFCRGNLIIEASDNNFNLALAGFFLKIENETWHHWITKKDLKESKSPNFYINDSTLWGLKIDDSTLINRLFDIVLNLNNAKKLILYTNDLRTLTARFLLWEVENREKGVNCSYSIVNDTFYFLKLIYKEKEITVKNSTLFFGEFLKSKSQSAKNEIYASADTNTKSNELLVVSNRMDECLSILNNCVKSLIPTWHNKRFSIASISRAIFLKKFNNYCINLILDAEIDTILRESYYGGRDEIFANSFNDETILYFDFPSMHPHIMLENFYTGNLINLKSPKNFSRPGIYKIKAYSDSSNEFPILPIRFNKKNEWKHSSVYYVNGEVEGWYTNETIEYFTASNAKNKVIEIKEAFVYDSDKSKPIFKNFVSTFLKLKNESKSKQERGVFKFILNSLSGRLGIKTNETATFFINEKEYKVLLKDNTVILSEERFSNLNEKPEQCVYLITLLKKNEDKFIKSRIDLPIFINSRSNIKLHKNISNLRKEGAKVLAVKTDSIYVAIKENYRSRFLNKKIMDVAFGSDSKDNTVKHIAFLNPSTYSIKFEDSSEKTYFYNKETNDFNFNDFYTASKINFNQKSINIGNGVHINSYRKRNWTNFNRASTPKLLIKNNLD